jgi:hypothetical protein
VIYTVYILQGRARPAVPYNRLGRRPLRSRYAAMSGVALAAGSKNLMDEDSAAVGGFGQFYKVRGGGAG